MNYQKERDKFISQATAEGLDVDTCRKLLRYATTLQRLAEAQCNGDWPYNGDRDRPYFVGFRETIPDAEVAEMRLRQEKHDRYYTICPKCEAGVAKSTLRTSGELGNGKSGYPAERIKVCPDCRTQELVRALLASVTYKVKTSTMPATGFYSGQFHAIFQGDPRGAVLALATPKYPYDERGRNGAMGLCVPARGTPTRRTR